MEKEQYFYRLFEHNFSAYRYKRIALYGTTDKTWVLLREFPEYNFVAIMHKEQTGTFCGLPIIKPSELLDLQVEVVIIVARNHNVAIVAERIKDICVENDIKVFSVAGLSMYDYGVTTKVSVMYESTCGSMNRLARSRYRGILEQPLNKYDFKMLELFADKILQKDNASAKVVVESLYDYAYAFLAPMVTSFVFFIIRQLQECKFDKVLFAARDGFLIHKLYGLAKKKLQLTDLPEDIYFQTSRMACIAAATLTGEDFFFLNTLPCAYDAKYMAQYRYDIPADKLTDYNADRYPSTFDYLIANKEVVLEASVQLRENYLAYMKQKGILPGERCAFVDLVSSGTCQMMLSRFADVSFEGIYMGRYEVDGDIRRDLLPVKALYEKRNLDEQNDWKSVYLFEHYWFMETVLTSFEPSLKYFDKAGNPVLCEEKRNADDMKALAELQAGINDFFEEYLALLGDEMPDIHSNVGDILYRYGSEEYTDIRLPYFETQVLFEDLGLGVLNAKDN